MAERFFLTSKSGLRLECGIDRDVSKPKQPLVFIAGGFGSNVFDVDSTYPPRVDLFLKHGFAVFRMNFRGIGASEGDLAHATVSAGLEDMAVALEYIGQLPWVESIGLIGSSYGGGLAFHEAAERKHFDYKFLILLSPRIDTRLRFEEDESIDWAEWEKKEYLVLDGAKMHYSLYLDSLDYRPWEVAERIEIPTLIVHGDADDVCPYDLSERLHRLIKTSQLATISGLKHRYKERIGEVLEPIGKWLEELGI